MQSEAFFFISSLGFILVGALLAALIIYVMRAVKSFNRLVDKVEDKLDNIEDVTMDIVDDFKDTVFYRMFIQTRRKSHPKELKGRTDK